MEIILQIENYYIIPSHFVGVFDCFIILFPREYSVCARFQMYAHEKSGDVDRNDRSLC